MSKQSQSAHLPEGLNVLFKIFYPIVHWDTATGKEVLKGNGMHPRKSARLCKGKFFSLEEHDSNFLPHFSLSHASCR